MSLRNYSYEDCKSTIPGGGWIAAELTLPLPRYTNFEGYKRARYANALRNGEDAYRDEHHLHLLDGGLVDNQGVQSLTKVLVSPHSPARILEAINSGRVRRIAVIAVNARADKDNGVGGNPAVPGLLKVVNTVIGAPIDSTTARSNASLQDLVDTLYAAGASPVRAPGSRCLPGCGSTTFPSISISSRPGSGSCRPQSRTSARAGAFRPSSCNRPWKPAGSYCASILAFSACCSISTRRPLLWRRRL